MLCAPQPGVEAKSQTEKPSIIIMRTTIGCGSGSGIEGGRMVGLWSQTWHLFEMTFKLQAPFIGDFPVPIGLNNRMDPLHQLKPQES